MEKFETKNGVSVRAYQGDAMTLLAFDLTAGLRDNLAGFSVRYKYKDGNTQKDFYIYNRMIFPDSFLGNNPGIPIHDRNSTLYSPIQKFNWVHVPNTDINTEVPVYGDYTYEVTPRYIEAGVLQPIKTDLTVSVTITVSPFDLQKTKVGFTRGFVSSVAYAKRFM